MNFIFHVTVRQFTNMCDLQCAAVTLSHWNSSFSHWCHGWCQQCKKKALIHCDINKSDLLKGLNYIRTIKRQVCHRVLGKTRILSYWSRALIGTKKLFWFVSEETPPNRLVPCFWFWFTSRSFLLRSGSPDAPMRPLKRWSFPLPSCRWSPVSQDFLHSTTSRRSR